MKKFIFINFYITNNLKRDAEYIYCIQKNLNLDFITNIFIFLDDKKDKKELKHLKNIHKAIFVNTFKSKVNLKDIFEYGKKNIADGSVIIIINLDIYLQNSLNWRDIDKNFFNIGHDEKALICDRINIDEKNYSKYERYLQKYSKKKGDFCDAWVFKTPLQKEFLKENLNFSLFGSTGGDSLLTGLMCKHYHVYNWGKKYKIYHKHSKNILIDNNIKKNYYMNVIKKNTDITPLLRLHQSARIPANQNFKYYLSKKIRPNYVMIKKNQNIFIIFRRIFYFTLIKYSKILGSFTKHLLAKF